MAFSAGGPSRDRGDSGAGQAALPGVVLLDERGGKGPILFRVASSEAGAREETAGDEDAGLFEGWVWRGFGFVAGQ